MPEKEKYINEIEKLRKEIAVLKIQSAEKLNSEFQTTEIYKNLYDDFNTLVFLTDTDSDEIIYSNKKVKDIYGETDGKRCWEVFQNNQTQPCPDCDFKKIKDKFGIEISDMNWQHLNSADNKWYFIHDAAVQSEGSLKRLSVAFDIQDFKKLQQQNLERTKNLQLIFNRVNEIVFVVQNQKFKFVNKATERFFGMNSEQLINKYVTDFIELPIKERIIREYVRISTDKNTSHGYFIKVRDGNNNIKDTEIKTDLIQWEGEKSLLIVLHDITEERKLNKDLKEREKYYKVLFDFSPMPILIYSGNKIALFNKAFKKYVKDSDLLKLDIIYFPEVVHPDSKEKLSNALKKIEEGTNFVSVENIKVYNFEKEIINFSLVMSSITFQNKPALIVIINDITGQIKAEEELRKTIAVKDRFFSIIAHDLRNPFNQIMGFADLLKEDFEKNDVTRMKRLTDYIYLSAENGHKLLENLLSWAKSQTGSVAFNPENVKLTDIIFETISFYKFTADKKNIKIIFNEEIENQCVFFDKEMLKTVFRNLISNAIKFTENNGEIEIVIFDKKEYVQINISDTGIGISEEQKEKIFKIDEVFTMTGTDNEKGSGLGLVVCKEFIEKNKGKIFVESESGKGSVFSFTALKCID